MMKRSLLMLVALLALSAFVLAVAPDDHEGKTVEGTLVDLTCYAKGGFLTNDHGEMKNCGSMCAQGGLPVAVVNAEKEVTFLAAPAPAYSKYIGKEVRISGTNGKHDTGALIPEKLQIKEDGKWVDKKLPKTMM